MTSEDLIGAYVLATKYGDGDPGDQWAIGFVKSATQRGASFRYDIVDNAGVSFRANGFRRVSRISAKRGAWILARTRLIETGARSLWWWVRQPMNEAAR